MTEEEFLVEKRKLELALLEAQTKSEISKLKGDKSEKQILQKNGWGTASVICSFIGLLLFGIIFAVIAFATNDHTRHTNTKSPSFSLVMCFVWIASIFFVLACQGSIVGAVVLAFCVNVVILSTFAFVLPEQEIRKNPS